MMRLILIGLACVSCLLAQGQNINKIEYFIDTEPGYGSGVNVPFTAAASVTDLTFSVPITSVSDGFHTLYVRSRDANSKWSVVQARPFYKVPASALTVPNLSRIEYFVDTDPGYGSASNVPFTAGTSVTDLAFNVDVSALAQGAHKLYVRSKDANNKWSVIQIKDFTVCNETAPVASAATAISTTGFTANWAAVAGATSYRLDVSADNFATFVSGNSDRTVTGATSASVTGLTSGTTYKYRVRAVNTCTSVSSVPIDVTTSFVVPAAPTGLQSAYVSSTGFELSWIGLAGVTEYRADVSTDNFATFATGWQNSALIFQNASTNRIGWSLLGLSPSTTYKVRLRAVNPGGTSSNSGIITVTTPAHPIMASPNLWINTVGVSGNQTFINALCSDAAGNVYAVGKFGGVITLGSTTLTAIGGADIYLVKYNSAGVVQWAKSIGGTGTDEGWQVAVDATGLYISGVFDGTVDFNPDAGTNSVATRGPDFNPRFNNLNDGFVAKYNVADGSYVWAQGIGDAWPEYYSRALTSDANNGVFLTGMFSGTNDFDPGAGTTNLTSLGGPDIFIMRLDASNGNFSWAKGMGSANWETGTSLLADGTNLFATGWYYGNIDLDPGAGTISANGSGMYLSRFVSATGALDFAKNFTNGGNYLEGYDLAKDNTNLYLTGAFGGTSDLDPNAGVSNISGNGGFVAKYSLANGSFVWAKALQSNSYMYPTRVIADQAGIYLSGNFAWLADFDPGANEANRVGNNSDIFVARYSSTDGSFQWAKSIGSGGSEYTRGGLTLTNDGLYLGGSFQNTVNFDPYTNVLTKTSMGDADGFIAKYQASPIAPPSAPTATVATAISTTSFTANWNLVSGATGYQLEISSDNFITYLPGYNSKSLTTLTENVTALTANTAYKYRVRAVNEVGASANSNVIDLITLVAPPPSPVAIAATSVSSTGFTAGWNSVSEATEYQLDISSDNFSTFLSGYNSKSLTGITEIVTGLTANATYTYRVRAVNAGGASLNSNVISVTTLTSGPIAPVATAATSISSTGFTANWNAVTEATGYQLDISSDNFSTYLTGYNSKSLTGITETISGLVASTSYQYRVRAVNANGTSVNSNTINITTGAAGVTPPVAPVALAASTITQISFQANWGSVVSATGYQLDVSSDNFGSFLSGYNSKVLGLVTSETISGLTSGASYQYRVRAFNTGGVSANSNAISVSTNSSTKTDQTITFNAISTKTLGDAPFTIGATASSGLVVSYATASDKITIANGVATIVKAGRETIEASQPGNATFNPATTLIQSFCIKPAKPTVTISSGTNTETINLASSATTGNQWFKDGTAISGATNATLSVTGVGVYKVQVKVDDCVSDFSAEVPLIITGDINSHGDGVTVYPNPVEDYLEVRGITGNIANSHLFDMTGRSNSIDLERKNEIYQANVRHLSAGVYLLRVQQGKSIHQIKFIKK